MKNTRETIAVIQHSTYTECRTVWQDGDRYFIKDRGKLTEVFKKGSGFYFRHQIKEMETRQ